MKRPDLAGFTFGRLTVIAFSHVKDSNSYWHCRCICGAGKTVAACSLKQGRTKSCGCFRKEHGASILTHNKYSETHGLSNTQFYHIWENVNARCNNRKNTHYTEYGGRGIKVEWSSFEDFWVDMFASYLDHKRLNATTTIERKNNDGNYSKDNCRWATRKEQLFNRRCTRFIELNGEKKTASQWSETTGIDATVIVDRIKKLHWPIEKALTEPKHER